MDLREPDNQPRTVAGAAAPAELSEREREILVLVATGASNKLIAQRLTISPNTVKVHLRNIFGKIGVASRTEAALYAIRAGLVQLPPGQLPAGDDEIGALETAPGNGAAEARAAGVPGAGWAQQRLWLMAGVVVVLVLVGVAVAWQRTTRDVPGTPAPTLITPRWQARADLPTARSGLAAAAYENQIYAIGGEAATGVTGSLERYDPATDQWTTLAPKPVAVADVGAAVIGGLIFVPGGRQASGEITDVVEVYDPRQDTWEARAPLPEPLSGYALLAFEGRLYVFGGWDGRSYVATVFAYDPREDKWTAATPMLTARAFAGAAAAGERIYVVGGENAGGRLAVNEEYQPSRDPGQEVNPWHTKRDLPEARSGLGAVSVADLIMIVEGREAASSYSIFQYSPQSDTWQSFELKDAYPRHGAAVAVLGTYIYLVGGQQASGLSAQTSAYQIIYNVLLPIVQ